MTKIPKINRPADVDTTQSSSGDETSRATPTRKHFTDIAEVRIGPERRVFYIHIPILTENSELFKRAMSSTSGFKESQVPKFAFDDVPVSVFEYFSQWLYTQSVAHEKVDRNRPEYAHIIKLYIFADMVQSENCINDILNRVATLIKDTNTVPNAEDTVTLWDALDGNDKDSLKRLIIDAFADKKTTGLFSEIEGWDDRFMRDLIIKLKKDPYFNFSASENPRWAENSYRCLEYHKHRDTKVCYSGQSSELGEHVAP